MYTHKTNGIFNTFFLYMAMEYNLKAQHVQQQRKKNWGREELKEKNNCLYKFSFTIHSFTLLFTFKYMFSETIELILLFFFSCSV